MRIGNVCKYKNKYVYITAGDYQVNGRLSNFWSFKYIKEDGTLYGKGGDYDNGNFHGSYKYTIKININNRGRIQ